MLAVAVPVLGTVTFEADADDSVADSVELPVAEIVCEAVGESEVL